MLWETDLVWGGRKRYGVHDHRHQDLCYLTIRKISRSPVSGIWLPSFFLLGLWLWGSCSLLQLTLTASPFSSMLEEGCCKEMLWGFRSWCLWRLLQWKAVGICNAALLWSEQKGSQRGCCVTSAVQTLRRLQRWSMHNISWLESKSFLLRVLVKCKLQWKRNGKHQSRSFSVIPKEQIHCVFQRTATKEHYWLFEEEQKVPLLPLIINNCWHI